ncbi:MAG: protein kinase [Myxococcales bacterium]|nr:protein kinase [Myxococcales bacterium]
MATVHLGQLKSASGFQRTVAIKRLHPNLAKSPEFVAMFVDEAKLAGRVQHPNVVSALDCIAEGGAVLLVMDYVHGVSLDQAQRIASKNNQPIPLPVASAIVIGALLGLHAAHEAVDETGKNLSIVHRDASPHNILVGVDGLARVLDFGIAKAAERAAYTRTGEVKGKLPYMAPEQFFHEPVGRETDVYSVGVVLWELVTGRRLFASDTQAQILMRVTNNQIEAPRSVVPDLPAEIEAVVMKALARSPADRYRTAMEFAIALEACIPPAPQRVVGDWIAALAKPLLVRRLELQSELPGVTGSLSHHPPSEADDVITSRFTLPVAANEASPASEPSFVDPRQRRSRLIVVSTILFAAAVTAVTFAWARFSVADKPGPTAAAGSTSYSAFPPPVDSASAQPAVPGTLAGTAPSASGGPAAPPIGRTAVPRVAGASGAPGTAGLPVSSGLSTLSGAGAPDGAGAGRSGGVHPPGHPSARPMIAGPGGPWATPGGASAASPASSASAGEHGSELDIIGGRE